jgi:hypothetical protein
MRLKFPIDIAASERRSGADPHVLRDEADVIVARFEELKNSGNEPAFEAWKEDRHQMVLKWREVRLCAHYPNNWLNFLHAFSTQSS